MTSVCRYITDKLSPLYGRNEARAIAMALLSHLWPGKNSAQLLLLELNDEVSKKVSPYVDRLVKGEPIQYVIGETEFYGLNIHVEPGVLIPRPETELLVEILADRFEDTDGLSFLDIGTGSGCIALALKSVCRQNNVEAWDVSPAALSIARRNAQTLGLEVTFRQVDILSHETSSEASGSYDLIVSNPPYIPEEEKAGMEQNVLDYEPSIALFVKDSDPMLFYRKIAHMAIHLLNDNGILAFEINPRFADDMEAMLRGFGFRRVIIMPDQFERKRFIIAFWKHE